MPDPHLPVRDASPQENRPPSPLPHRSPRVSPRESPSPRASQPSAERLPRRIARGLVSGLALPGILAYTTSAIAGPLSQTPADRDSPPRPADRSDRSPNPSPSPMAQQVSTPETRPLQVVYPPNGRETTSDRIFLIGSAPPDGTVTVNGQAIQRSPAGHFAPSFPLALGENRFNLRHGSSRLTVTVVRVDPQPPVPDGMAFAPGSLEPARDIARQPGEPICFRAIAPPDVQVSVRLGDRTVPLAPLEPAPLLPENSAVLTGDNAPRAIARGRYGGCAIARQPGNWGTPIFELRARNAVPGASPDAPGGPPLVQQPGPGAVEILSPTTFEVAEVIAEAGVARTGPGTDYSRLTPLPRGTQAAVTGREGDWLRLDYGGWIRASETRTAVRPLPPQSTIRSVRSRRASVGDPRPTAGATEVLFPLEVPVPVTVVQGDRELVLTLHNTTAQTDTIAVPRDLAIDRLDWSQPEPGRVDYRFRLRGDRAWGYTLRYEGATLVLTLRHGPPRVGGSTQLPLEGTVILLDPGHGGEELGAVGPDGTPEKAIDLALSLKLRRELVARGAEVILTREDDRFVSLDDRRAAIARTAPTLALSVHYNALPDSGDAEATQGIGTFWYHPQAQGLAEFLHDYLTQTLDRPAYGVFWGNLALTRPSAAPTVLLELGFLINPWEFEWIADPAAQDRLAIALADGLVAWFERGD